MEQQGSTSDVDIADAMPWDEAPGRTSDSSAGSHQRDSAERLTAPSACSCSDEPAAPCEACSSHRVSSCRGSPDDATSCAGAAAGRAEGSRDANVRSTAKQHQPRKGQATRCMRSAHSAAAANEASRTCSHRESDLSDTIHEIPQRRGSATALPPIEPRRPFTIHESGLDPAPRSQAPATLKVVELSAQL